MGVIKKTGRLKRFWDRLNAPMWTPLGVLAFSLWVEMPRYSGRLYAVALALFILAIALRVFYQFCHPESYRVCATCFVDIQKIGQATNKYVEEKEKRRVYECALCKWQCSSSRVEKDEISEYGGKFKAKCEECKVTRRFMPV